MENWKQEPKGVLGTLLREMIDVGGVIIIFVSLFVAAVIYGVFIPLTVIDPWSYSHFICVVGFRYAGLFIFVYTPLLIAKAFFQTEQRALKKAMKDLAVYNFERSNIHLRFFDRRIDRETKKIIDVLRICNPTKIQWFVNRISSDSIKAFGGTGMQQVHVMSAIEGAGTRWSGGFTKEISELGYIQIYDPEKRDGRIYPRSDLYIEITYPDEFCAHMISDDSIVVDIIHENTVKTLKLIQS